VALYRSLNEIETVFALALREQRESGFKHWPIAIEAGAAARPCHRALSSNIQGETPCPSIG